MDFDSSSKFIASLAKFLQSLCNGYVDFDKGVEVIGHIYINVDSDTGKKVDYVLNEKVCKNDNSITFISNSFHAQPAEKPKPPPKKPIEIERDNDDSVVLEDTGQMLPNSTNVGTMGSYKSPSRAAPPPQDSYGGGRYQQTPPYRNSGKHSNSATMQGMPPSPRYQDSGGYMAKRNDMMGGSLVNSGSLNSGADDCEGGNVFQSGEEEDSQNLSSFLDGHGGGDVDQKPVIDPDVSIVKEEYLSSQNAGSYPGSHLSTGHRIKNQHASAYPIMMHQSPTGYPGSAPDSPVTSLDSYTSSLHVAGDPSTLTRAQQEELEMYYRKGTDQHLTFLRNMREAHAMYPFTGKRDKELFDKALAELFLRLPVLQLSPGPAQMYFLENSRTRIGMRNTRLKAKLLHAHSQGQFKAPSRGGVRGHQFGRQHFHGSPSGFPYPPVHYQGSPGSSGHRALGIRKISASSEGSDSFIQASEENYDYQHLASDDSRDEQPSVGDMSQAGFTGVFDGGSSIQPELESQSEAHQPSGDGQAGAGLNKSPPDIKYEVTPMPFIKTSDFELIEIDPEKEDDL